MITFLPVQISTLSSNVLPKSVTGAGALDLSYNLFYCNPAAADITVTLPAIGDCIGAMLTIKNMSAYNITIDANGAETIDGSTTKVLSQKYQAVSIYNNGTEWLII
jgi:hypothetical protein